MEICVNCVSKTKRGTLQTEESEIDMISGETTPISCLLPFVPRAKCGEAFHHWRLSPV